MSDLRDMRCQSCRFWRESPEFGDPADSSWGFGSCRRRPPTLVDTVVQAIMPRARYGDQVDPEIDTVALMPASLWPSTHSSDWCGEFDAGATAVPL
jgi:hypothetical protein